MVLHKILVELDLTYASDKDAEMKLAHFISKKFQEAAALFVVRKFKEHNDTFWLFRLCLVEVWKPSMRRTKKFIVNDPLLESEFPDLCGEQRPVEISMLQVKDGGVLGESLFGPEGYYSGMRIGTGDIEKAENLDDFNKEFAQLIATIYHECDHIYSPAEESGSANVEGKLLYYMDKAEIRAHAKELAFLFHQAFPGKKYNHKTFSNYVLKHYKSEHKSNQMVQFLKLFRDPATFNPGSGWKDYVHYVKMRVIPPGHLISVKKCKKTYRVYLHFIVYFVNYFNENLGHRL